MLLVDSVYKWKQFYLRVEVQNLDRCGSGHYILEGWKCAKIITIILERPLARSRRQIPREFKKEKQDGIENPDLVHDVT